MVPSYSGGSWTISYATGADHNGHFESFILKSNNFFSNIGSVYYRFYYIIKPELPAQVEMVIGELASSSYSMLLSSASIRNIF